MTDETHASAGPAPSQAVPTTPSGIGGWLILPMLGLFSSVVFEGLRLPAIFSAFSTLSSLPDATQASLLSGDLVLIIILAIIAPAILLLLMFSRSRRFPRFYVVWAIVGAIFAVLDLALGYSYTHDALEAEGTSFFNAETWRTLLSAAVGVCIWVPYMMNSVRVKNTFVK
jgi:hypothetical protein